MPTILGLNAYHGDSAACLIVDGKLVAAAEEERFRRIKHWAGLPTNAIDYCLREAKLNLREIEHIAINRKPGVNNLRRLGFVLTRFPHPKLIWQKIANIRSAATVKETIEKAYGMELPATLHYVEHHMAHMASAFLVSGFEEAACISIDGFGDFASTAMGAGKGSELKIDGRVYFPHSLGVFYSALTQFLGFPHYGDEYKIMGLAPYGDPNYLDQLRDVVRIQSDGTFRLNLKYFRHHVGDVSYDWKDCAPTFGLLYKSTLVDLLGPPRAPHEPLEQKHKDLARSVQATYEKAFFALLHALHKKHPSENLALAGGCAMNSVANGKVYRRTPFKKMYLPAAAGDAGGAIGAAAIVLAQLSANGDQSSQVEQPAAVEPAERAPVGIGSSLADFEAAGQKREIRDQMFATANPSSGGSDVSQEDLSNLNPQPSTSSDLPSDSSTLNPHPSTNPDDPWPLASGDAFRSQSPAAGRPISKGSRRIASCDAYLGPESTEEEIHALLDWKKKEIAFAECVTAYVGEEDLVQRVAQAIADGKVVGWFQGRMEWGPRALGNRSILADPRRADMKDILNAKIKRRESFRPFAPSILREAVSEWFEQDDDVPFMMEVFQIRAQKRSFIPAVTHVDGSGRLQTVHKETNPRYYKLIEHFRELTGIPMVLNTSFNENEPVVCYPEEALDCFLRTQMDLLVLGNFLIERSADQDSQERKS